MSAVDGAIVLAYLVLVVALGFAFRRRAGRDVGEYFLSGRNLPWWIAGTSMVATSFAADTPLVVTGLVGTQGIAGNWLWWNLAASHVLATFFFARLWRRAGVLTDLELVDLRYSGAPARLLRGFRALWEGVLLNSIILGWVILAMVKILDVLVDLEGLTRSLGLDLPGADRWAAIVLCLVVALVYTVLSGFWGVVSTDLIQFVLAMVGSILLAVLSLRRVGGVTGLKERLAELHGDAAAAYLAFVPEIGGPLLPTVTFVAFVSVHWWSVRQVDGGNILAQRMLASRTEEDSFLASLWFTLAHYVLRPWPWILVALVSLVLFPDLADRELAYPMMVLEVLPAGLVGLLVASFLAAFMSTVDSQLNWGAALLVNDLYRPFLRRRASEEHYVAAARLAVALLMLCGASAALLMQSIVGAYQLFFGMTAGIGGVYICRWLWWRVSAWSELTAWVAAAATYLAARVLAPELAYGWRLILSAGVATLLWVTVTLLTPPTDAATLERFYRRVRPGSPWWRPVAEATGVAPAERLGWHDVTLWAAGVVLVYAALFGLGRFLLDGWLPAIPYLLASLTAATWIVATLRRPAASAAPPPPRRP